MLCETQSVSSRIWTRIAVSISYDDNHYTTGTSKSLVLLSSLLWEFFAPALADGLSLESEWQQVSSSLQDLPQYSLKYAVDWIVSARPLISKSYNPFTNSLRIVRSAPITIGITVTFMFNIFLFSGKVLVLNSLFAFSYFHFVVRRDDKVYYLTGSFLLLTRSGRLARIRWSVSVSENIVSCRL